MERTIDFPKAVAAFGGYSALARRLKVPLSTLHGWHRRNKVPKWRCKEIIALARAEKKDIYKLKRGARHKQVA